MCVADTTPEPPPSSSKLSLKLSEHTTGSLPQPPADAEVEPLQPEPVAQAQPIQPEPPELPVQSVPPAQEPPKQTIQPAEEPDLDWMSEMPDLDDLVTTEADQEPEAVQTQPAQP